MTYLASLIPRLPDVSMYVPGDKAIVFYVLVAIDDPLEVHMHIHVYCISIWLNSAEILMCIY
jgi:hypothetical protein